MNNYEHKQADKKERIRNAAIKRRVAANRLHDEGITALQAIPFGQPILVGHHSEKGDRAYRGRATGKIDRSFRLMDEANALDSRADSIGTGGVSSDDPEAVSKLESRLASLKAHQNNMRASNAAARKAKTEAPYRAYQLSNNNANIRRYEQRIATLRDARDAAVWGPFVGPGWLAEEHKDDNRIVFKFREIPSPDLRALLKSRAFKWSPTRGLWIRQTTGRAKFAAEQIISYLKK